MKTIGKHEDIARITGTGLALAALFAMVLLSPSAGRAQSRASSPPIAAATPAKAAPALQPAAASGAKPGGNHEGITVHGHWVIEVKNPDGTVTARREFENSLSSGGNGNGAGLLAALLGRSLSAGSWNVVLYAGNYAFDVSEANSGSATYCQNVFNQNASALSCFSSLSIAAPTFNTNAGLGSGTTLTLTGSFTVPQNYNTVYPTSLNVVQTNNVSCVPSTSPATCLGQTGWPLSLTTRGLDGLNGDPAPVPFAPGQVISVTVIISFQ